jgi:hypothetical protein
MQNDIEASSMEDVQATQPEQNTDRYRDRYGPIVRGAASILAGALAGVLLISSLEAGVGLALEGQTRSEWNLLTWGSHWAWRAAASATATALAGFVTGVVARRRGTLFGSLSAVPAALYWATVAWIGWSSRVPFTELKADIPLGYQIVAAILALTTIPLAGAAGSSGAPYGRANAEHFDSRRVTLLGIRWYHYLWLPLPMHFMVLSASYGSVYGFNWITTAWKGDMSFWAIVPTLFAMGLFWTLQLLAIGGFGAYEALAGFESDGNMPAWKRVIKFGFGYLLLAVLAQVAISLVHSGLSAVARKFFG